VESRIVSDHAARLWALHRDNVKANVAAGSLRRMVVNAIEADGTIQVREVGTNVVHDEPYVALDGTTGFAIGQYVIVGEVMGRGPESGSTRIVLGRVGAGSAAMLVDAASQATADTTSTASVTTFANAITLTLTLGTGTWTVKASGSVLLSHNVNQGSWRMEIDGDFSNTHTLSMVTEERFGAAHRVAGISGGRTINVRVQYRSNTAGTTSARNPMVEATAVRTA
jgi:hypothetical protein